MGYTRMAIEGRSTTPYEDVRDQDGKSIGRLGFAINYRRQDRETGEWYDWHTEWGYLRFTRESRSQQLAEGWTKAGVNFYCEGTGVLSSAYISRDGDARSNWSIMDPIHLYEQPYFKRSDYDGSDRRGRNAPEFKEVPPQAQSYGQDYPSTNDGPVEEGETLPW